MVLLGGIIGKRDIPVLEEMGAAQVFLPGTPPERIVQFIESNLGRISTLKGAAK
jgi:methylmalonyl-CoA mutase cobalamin-binding domain/chain